MEFTGFADDTREFLAELAAHNERPWFERNKSRYQSVLLEPERAFVTAVGQRLQAIRLAVEAVPRVNGSIFRINRDTRFSKDKTPYKTYADMWFWEGADRKNASGFFVRIVPDAVWLGAGAHTLSPEGLERLRAAIAARSSGLRIGGILADLEAAGYTIGEAGYKRVPRGYPADHPRAELLKYRFLHAYRIEPVPTSFTEAGFVDWCMERFEEVEPLHGWLVDVLG